VFKRLLNVSLQTKITGLLIGVIISVIVIFSGLSAYTNVKQVFSSKNKLSLQTAKTVALLPSVKEGITEESGSLQYLTDQFSIENDADFIIIQDKDGQILTHPQTEYLGEIHEFDSGYIARVYGGVYTLESDEFVDPSILGIAPVLSDSGNILGVVTVGFLKENVYAVIFDRLKNIFYFTLIVIVIGFILGYLLTRHIRKEMLGYEPREIASLYREQHALLSALNEGVLATDKSGGVTLFNQEAKKLLHIEDADFYIDRPVHKLFPEIDFGRISRFKYDHWQKELYLHDKMVIMNIVPILNNGDFAGMVIILRDKTEMTEMINALSEVRQYSDDLRAQTHEFSNTMHLISGMIQLGKYEEVSELINHEVNTAQKNNQILKQIEDVNVQAILLGKAGKASEKKVDFQIDENSFLSELPKDMEVSDLITIIGNLIDNALEEVVANSHTEEQPQVIFSALDFGSDIIFEVSDNGRGIKEKDIEKLFKPGYSTKESNNRQVRGFGLFNVKSAIDKFNGSIEIDSDAGGTTITVYIPKQLQEGESMDDKNSNNRR